MDNSNLFPKRWRLSKESKLQQCCEPQTAQADLKKLLFDEESEIRMQAAKHPGLNPNDALAALEQYPELKDSSIQMFLLWQWSQSKK